MDNFKNNKNKIAFLIGIFLLTHWVVTSYAPSFANSEYQAGQKTQSETIGILKGQVVVLNGSETISGFQVTVNTFYPQPYEYTEIDFVDTMEFEMAIPEGEYQFLLQSFAPLVTAFKTDDPVVIKAGQTLDLGKIPLVSASSTLEGKFITSSGNPIPLTRFTLVNLSCHILTVPETAGSCVVFNRFEETNELGEYEVQVSPGEWELAVTSSTDYAYLGPPVRVEVAGDTVISDFDVVFQEASSRVMGKIIDENGEQITGHTFNIDAYVDGSYHFVAPIATSSGTFDFPAVEGEYTLNISSTFDEIDYFIPHTVTVTVPTNDSDISLEIVGLLPSATLKGAFFDYRTDEAVTGLSGTVYAYSEHYWKSARTFFDSDDEYDLNLPEGTWEISFNIYESGEENQYDSILGGDTTVDISKNLELILDMPVVKRDASVSGQVIDPTGIGVSNIRLKLEGQEELTGLNKYLELNEQGLFDLDVPYGTYLLEVTHRSSDAGSSIPPLDDSFIAPAAQTLILEPGENRTDYKIQYKTANSKLYGTVYVPGLAKSGALDLFIKNGNANFFKRVQVLSDGSNGVGQFSAELADGEWKIQAKMDAGDMSWQMNNQIIVQGDTQIALALEQSPVVFEKAQALISAQEKTVVQLSNGATIEADAGLLEDARFVSRLSLSMDELFPVNDEFVPIGPTYMVAAINDSDDEFRSKRLNHPITVTLPFSDFLTDTVLSSDLIVTSRLFPNDYPNQPSTELENIVINTDDQTIIFTIDNFGFVSLMVPANIAPAVPTFDDIFGNKVNLPIIIN